MIFFSGLCAASRFPQKFQAGSEDLHQMELYLLWVPLKTESLLCTWQEQCTKIWDILPPKSRGSVRIVLLSSSRNHIWNFSNKWGQPLIKLISCHLSVSTKSNVVLERTLGNVWRHCHNWRGHATGIQWLGVQDAAKHFTIQELSSPKYL